MGMVKGQKEYQKFKEGKPLTFKQAIFAQCYVCNGQEQSNEDCGCSTCPLYPFHPHNKNRLKRAKTGNSGFKVKRKVIEIIPIAIG